MDCEIKEILVLLKIIPRAVDQEDGQTADDETVYKRGINGCRINK